MRDRVSLTPTIIEEATEETIDSYKGRLIQKGSLSFASRHEILGLLLEEVDELREAIRNDSDLEGFINELKDIAVVCLHGVATLRQGEHDDC